MQWDGRQLDGNLKLELYEDTQLKPYDTLRSRISGKKRKAPGLLLQDKVAGEGGLSDEELAMPGWMD